MEKKYPAKPTAFVFGCDSDFDSCEILDFSFLAWPL